MCSLLSFFILGWLTGQCMHGKSPAKYKVVVSKTGAEKQEECLNECRTIWNAVACEWIEKVGCWAMISKITSAGGIDVHKCYIFPGETFTEVHI